MGDIMNQIYKNSTKEIEVINPHGYCAGVNRAIKIALDIVNKEDTLKPIYLLGNLIHNKIVTKKLSDLGIITILPNGRTRYEMLDDIESGTVIFSAHGISNRVREKAKNKGLNIIDASCGKVLVIHKRVLDYVNKNYDILYIGKKGHPECEAILEESNKIHLITSIEDVINSNIKSDKIYVTNQTTLSRIDTKHIYDEIEKKYPNAILDNNICNATTVRQEALMNQKGKDLCIIVGDKLSSNSNSLKKISEDYSHVKSILVESSNDLNLEELKKYHNISITSGASTPEDVFEAIIKKLLEE